MASSEAAGAHALGSNWSGTMATLSPRRSNPSSPPRGPRSAGAVQGSPAVETNSARRFAAPASPVSASAGLLVTPRAPRLVPQPRASAAGGRGSNGDASAAAAQAAYVDPQRPLESSGRFLSAAALGMTPARAAAELRPLTSEQAAAGHGVSGTLESDQQRAARTLREQARTDAEAQERRAKRREKCIVTLTESDLPSEVREHFLAILDEPWVLELLELYNDPVLPRQHWHEWCYIAMREGSRYPFIVRRMQARRVNLNRRDLADLLA